MVLGFLLYEAADFTWHFGEIDKLVIIERKLNRLESILEKDDFQKLLHKLVDTDGNEILKNRLPTDPKIDEI